MFYYLLVYPSSISLRITRLWIEYQIQFFHFDDDGIEEKEKERKLRQRCAPSATRKSARELELLRLQKKLLQRQQKTEKSMEAHESSFWLEITELRDRR